MSTADALRKIIDSMYKVFDDGIIAVGAFMHPRPPGMHIAINQQVDI